LLLAGCGDGTIGGQATSTHTQTGSGASGAGGQGGGVSTSGSSGGSGGAGGGQVVPPFDCEPVVTSSPALAAMMLFDPAQPHPGDTLTVIVRSTNNTKPSEAPSLQMQVTGAIGMSLESPTLKVGGGDTLYYFAIPDVQLGDICLLGLIDGTTEEISGKVTVTERPAGPPLTNGVFKVVTNHQWSCAEQPTNGNEIHIYVLDENDVGVPNAVIDVKYADSTDPATIHNGGGDIPQSVTTNGEGYFKSYNYWPISDNGLLVFQLSVQGAPSDIATELTTGWWETNDVGCNYCNQTAKNVWGHWSHTIVFKRDPAATEICAVETDHAGQSACALPGHLHHHPTHRACWPVP